MERTDGLILSAGKSERMGSQKSLLKYRGKSFLTNIILKMAVVCDQIVVVLGYNSSKIQNTVKCELEYPDSAGKNFEGRELLSKVKFVINPDYEMGMFTSLKKGVRELSGQNWILYHFVDQPGLPEEFYAGIIAEADASYDIVQPNFNKRKGHPLLLNRKTLNCIVKASPDSNLRKLIKETDLRIKNWLCPYEQVLMDLDYPSDLKNLI